LNKQHDEIQKSSSENNFIQTHLRVLKSLDDILISEDFSRVENLIKQAVTTFLDGKKDMLIASIVTVIQGMRVDPNKGFLISYLDNNLVDNIDNGLRNLNKLGYLLDIEKVEDYLNANHAPILDLANVLYDRILKIVQYRIFFKP